MSIFDQTSRHLQGLVAAIEDGAGPVGICIGYAAVLDQCAAAVREAEKSPPRSNERFESLAAAASAEAFGPVVTAVASGRTPERELRIRKQAAVLIARAFDAHARGDHETVGQYLLTAAALTAPNEGPQAS